MSARCPPMPVNLIVTTGTHTLSHTPSMLFG